MQPGNKLDPTDTLAALRLLGIELPSPAYIAGALIFGVIGLVAFRRGRKSGRHRTTGLGVALMFYPYLVSRTWLLFVIGAVLCAALWFDRT